MNQSTHRWPPQPAPDAGDLARMLNAVRREVGRQHDNRQVVR
jgi:hypothetical protein